MANPRIRAIEAFPVEQDGQRLVVVHDPAGLAAGQVVVSGPALYILSLMDGLHTLEEIQAQFARQFGQPLPPEELTGMIEQLDTAHFLESDRFRDYFQSLVDAYRASPARVSREQNAYGLGDAGLTEGLSRVLSRCEATVTGREGRRLAGLVAPHLDYPRGAPAYADAYGLLATVPPARRYVILGTNHFGRASGPVATTKDFQTCLGTATTDRAFLERLSARLGIDLSEHEFDHQAEHSVELQVILLQHLLGREAFEIVPILCHDPCGPTGTASYDGKGADLHAFAVALGELIRQDAGVTPTVVIAGADLSHVGRRFGDERDLDETFLREVEKQDRAALAGLTQTPDGEAFVGTIRGRQNRTRVCSSGCLYALRTALADARAELLRYHQAADPESGTCVTCSAMAFWV